MILYKAIKYKILDLCINILFDKILNNFIFKSIILYPSDILPGMRFKKIHLDNYGLFWEDVHIISREYYRKTKWNTGEHYYFDFNFSKTNDEEKTDGRIPFMQKHPIRVIL